MRNICLINRYYPPNPGISGEAAADLVAYISPIFPDVTVTVVHIDAPYLFDGLSPRKPAGEVIQLKTIFRKNNNPVLRFVRNMIEGYRLVKEAIEKADIIISMTDPPMLNYWSGSLCKKYSTPWVYWSVDLYPHAYQAAHLASETNLFFRHFMSSFRQNAPSLLISLGEAQAKFLQKHWRQNVPYIVLPCGIQNVPSTQEIPYWKKNDGKTYFAYAGNLSEPHSSEFLLDFLTCLDVKKHRCILALYGSQAQKVVKTVKKHPAIEIVPTIRRNELSYIDVHLVTLLPEWTHVSVPSKAVSAICAGRAILFNGLHNSDTWSMLKDAGWIITEFNNRDKRLSEINDILLLASNKSVLDQKHTNASRMKTQLLQMQSNAYQEIAHWIKGFHNN